MFGFGSPLRRVSFINLGYKSGTLSGADLRQILTDFLNERRRRKLLGGSGNMLALEIFWIFFGVSESFRQGTREVRHHANVKRKTRICST